MQNGNRSSRDWDSLSLVGHTSWSAARNLTPFEVLDHLDALFLWATSRPAGCASLAAAFSLSRRRRFAQRRAAGQRAYDERAGVAADAKSGKLSLLNTNARAAPHLPQVPSLAELGIAGDDVPIWFSIFAPAGTPKHVIAKFNAKIVELAR
jgi:Tripartite tricarboxylate transporter family receptor